MQQIYHVRRNHTANNWMGDEKKYLLCQTHYVLSRNVSRKLSRSQPQTKKKKIQKNKKRDQGTRICKLHGSGTVHSPGVQQLTVFSVNRHRGHKTLRYGAYQTRRAKFKIWFASNSDDKPKRRNRSKRRVQNYKFY